MKFDLDHARKMLEIFNVQYDDARKYASPVAVGLADALQAACDRIESLEHELARLRGIVVAYSDEEQERE